MELNTPVSRRVYLPVAVFAAAIAATVLYRLDPANGGLFPPCPFRALTGWYCPGCGSLRALHQLLHGNLRLAFAFNPFTVLTLPFLVYGSVSYGWFELRHRQLPRVFLPGWAIHGLALAVIVFCVVRNLGYPFSLLAPGGWGLN
jgi:uncharacterized protein DUF2752